MYILIISRERVQIGNRLVTAYREHSSNSRRPELMEDGRQKTCLFWSGPCQNDSRSTMFHVLNENIKKLLPQCLVLITLQDNRIIRRCNSFTIHTKLTCIVFVYSNIGQKTSGCSQNKPFNTKTQSFTEYINLNSISILVLFYAPAQPYRPPVFIMQ